jgi:transposase-like protein
MSQRLNRLKVAVDVRQRYIRGNCVGAGDHIPQAIAPPVDGPAHFRFYVVRGAEGQRADVDAADQTLRLVLSELIRQRSSWIANPSIIRYADRIMTDQTHPPMRYPHCQSIRVTRLKTPTELGYRRYQCRTCRRTYNERTETPFNFLEFPTDLVLLVVLWPLRYALNLRDVVELCLLRSVAITDETVRDWEQRFAPYLIEALQQRRRGQCSTCWHVDDTDVKVKGQWVDLYRAIDRNGNLVDTLLSATRSKKAAIPFFNRLARRRACSPPA